jgi:Conjugative transposon protein TcpC
MTGRRGRRTGRRSRRDTAALPLAVNGLLARFGRLALWVAVAVVLVRGLGDLLAPPRPTPTVRAAERTGDAWPDDAARAFAVEFATAYLHHSPHDDQGERARRIANFGAIELAGELAPRFARRAPEQAVRSATVAGSSTLDDQHALVTVAATVGSGGAVRTRYVSVPVARDAGGGLVVYDTPSFVAAPARAAVSPVDGEPLIGDERSAVADVVGRFLRAYLAGDSGALGYLVPPRTRIAAAAGGLELVELGSITSPADASGAERLVLVRVQARDAVSGALYALRYRVALVRRDRWYVAAVGGGEDSGR